MEKICGIHQGVIQQGGGAITVVPRRIFVPPKRYRYPKIKPTFFRTRFVKRSRPGSEVHFKI